MGNIIDLQWRMVKSLNMSTYHHSLCVDERYGVQMETITRKTGGGYGTGKPDTSFYINNDEREFKTEDDLIEAYNEKFKMEDEDPEHQVVYVKVIKKRNI